MNAPRTGVHWSEGGAAACCGATPGEVTGDPWDATCRACRAAMIARGMCPECGQERLSWGVHPQNVSGVADGRLTARDVITIFYLACDYCSETLIARVDPDVIAAALTRLRWVPRPGPAPAPTLPA